MFIIPKEYSSIVLFFTMMFCFGSAYSQNDIYWIGGTGDWSDQSHWFKDPEGLNPAGIIPSSNHIAHITDFSHTGNMWDINIPPGSYDVHSIVVETAKNFRFLFQGSNGNFCQMNIHYNLSLLSSHRLEYTNESVFFNSWSFVGNHNHDISSGGQNLSSVEFLTAGGTYNQLSDITANERIKMHGGTWNTNGYDVFASNLRFQDNNSSSNPLDKTFNAGTSEIHCDIWSSTFAYQSLEVTGNYKIFTKQFLGSPGNQFLSFYFNEIHLLNFDDIAPGGFSQIEHNNLDCSYCVIEKVIVEDTSRVQLAGIFTIEDKLEIVNLGTTILFNGGNVRLNEVMINGSIKTPKVTECDDVRPIFSNVYNDYTIFIRTLGSLTIYDSEINNIQTQGGAVFTADNSVLQGASTGWNISEPPVAIDYYWLGTIAGYGDWNNPSNWVLENGDSNGCIPTIVDNVFIDNGAKGPIRIPYPYKAFCNNFKWSNDQGEELLLDGGISARSQLLIAGDFELNSTAIINTVNYHYLIFSSTKTNIINTSGVELPDIIFIGDLGHWQLESDLTCTKIDVEGGTIETQDFDITTDQWRSLQEHPKHFIFGKSTITVNGEMKLAELPNNNVTVDFGTSRIVCKLLTSAVPQLYDVEMINTNSVLMDNWPVEFNKLILSGSAPVSTIHNMTLNDLVFNVDDSELKVSTVWDFTINEGIQSYAAKTNPGILRSYTSGTQAGIDKEFGNICVVGYVDFTDIKSDLDGVFHAPLGGDEGNNTDIIFEGGSSLSLFWIGGTDDEWSTKANWSRVSGGCPSNKAPHTSPNLEFDSNSFFSEENVINISSLTTANNVFFYNKEELKILISDNFVPQSINILGGDARFEGETMEVEGTTQVGPVLGYPGLLITDLNYFSTFTFSGAYGIWIVRSDSQAAILND